MNQAVEPRIDSLAGWRGQMGDDRPVLRVRDLRNLADPAGRHPLVHLDRIHACTQELFGARTRVLG